MDNSFIPRAIDTVKDAIAADNNQDYDIALGLYKKSLEYFMTGLKYETNPVSTCALACCANFVRISEQYRQYREKQIIELTPPGALLSSDVTAGIVEGVHMDHRQQYTVVFLVSRYNMEDAPTRQIHLRLASFTTQAVWRFAAVLSGLDSVSSEL